MRYNEKGNTGKTLQKWWNGLDVVFSLASCFLSVSLKMHLLRSLLPPSDARKRKTAQHRTFDGRVRHYFRSTSRKRKKKKQESEKRGVDLGKQL